MHKERFARVDPVIESASTRAVKLSHLFGYVDGVAKLTQRLLDYPHLSKLADTCLAEAEKRVYGQDETALFTVGRHPDFKEYRELFRTTPEPRPLTPPVVRNNKQYV